MPTQNGITTFHAKIECVEEGKKKKYEGSFSVRHAGFDDLGAISAALSRMTQGQPIVEPMMAATLQAIATLSICVETAPDWWDEVIRTENVQVMMAVNTLLLEERNASPFRETKIVRPSTNETCATALGSRGVDPKGVSEQSEEES